MNKAQKIVFRFFIISLVVIGILTYMYYNKPQQNHNNLEGLILYYGESCPHCKVVDEFLESNNISAKISYEHKEVFKNKTNSLELEKAARICEISTASIGVPFLYDNGKCYVGDEPIISFFENKLKDFE